MPKKSAAKKAGKRRRRPDDGLELADVDIESGDSRATVLAYSAVDAAHAPVAPGNRQFVLSFEDLKVETTPSSSSSSLGKALSLCQKIVIGRKSSTSAGDGRPKVLIDSINGAITGGFWAVMGPSGSGKTTLLSSLSLRLDARKTRMAGKLKLNGLPYSRAHLKAVSGYVMQDDLVHSHLTVEETLLYSAELRVGGAARTEGGYGSILQRVREVIGLVQIEHCKDVVVGDTRRKGISGGERKRLCIAMELLSKPQLLFLDEPTSGLDSANALSLCKLLRRLSKSRGVTVVCTIHQPQAKIFKLFDNLILMRSGCVVYQGNAKTAVRYFCDRGYPLPEGSSPADHLIDILQPDYEPCREDDDDDAGAPDPDRTQRGGQGAAFTNMRLRVAADFGSALPPVPKRDAVPWARQLVILWRRGVYFHAKRWDILLMNLFITMLIATFTSMSTWYHIGTGKASASRRQPALFFCVIHQGIVSSLQGSHSFPLERAIMLRERSAGSYHVSAYFLAKTLSDMLAQLFPPVVFTCIVYPIIGFQSSLQKFFTFMAFMILDSAASTALSNMISCICVGIEMSTVMLAAAYEIVRLYGGWFISPAQISSYPDWKFADALSYIKYAFVGVSLNEHGGLLVACSAAERTPPFAPGEQTTSNCKIPPLTTMPYDGNNYNSYYGYDKYTISGCAGALLLYIFVCRLISYLALRFIKV